MYCYIHIPFCQSRCRYCRFSTFSGKNDIDKQIYVDFLVKEIVEYKNLDAIQRRFPSAREGQILLKSIYFGGGTPTSLNNSQLEKIINTLKNKFWFENDIEITLETTIINITKENLIEWKKLGVNRLSLGIQTLNNDSLKEIGRPNKEEIIEKLDTIKRDRRPVSGVNKSLSISLDFIIGLPYVKIGEVRKDIQFIIKKYDFVNHISLYVLEEYYDYPKKWQELSIGEDEYLEEYKNCKKYLEDSGFSRYELSNFAKQGFECLHNKAYWDHSDIISFGLGSHGYLNQTRYAYPNNFKDYYAGIIDYKEDLSEKDLFLENVMFGLRTNGLEKIVYQKLNKEKINYFIEQKLLDIEDNKLILKDDGVTLIDYIIKEII
ncbi:radical SAM family heme chaperone HemW [Candidatus Gracilibacteria bacterium]|nr:radical SAM family heme chaperone HemW [Candidatus Gracilibacteria bacterium]